MIAYSRRLKWKSEGWRTATALSSIESACLLYGMKTHHKRCREKVKKNADISDIYWLSCYPKLTSVNRQNIPVKDVRSTHSDSMKAWTKSGLLAALFLENFPSVLYCGWLGGCSAKMEHVLKLHLYPVSLSPDSCFTFPTFLSLPSCTAHIQPLVWGATSHYGKFSESEELLVRMALIGGSNAFPRKGSWRWAHSNKKHVSATALPVDLTHFKAELRGPHTSCTQPDQQHDNDNR